MSGDAELTVSVVIPSYRRLDGLAPLIDAYRTEGADQIVVVLDGPHAGWREALGSRADAPDVRVVELAENRGLALARIAGLEGATGDVILAVDDDVQPLPGLVDAHRRFHRDGGDRVLLGYMPVTLPARRGRDASPTYLYARDYEIQAGVWRRSGSDLILTSLWGGNFSLPRDLYERAERYKPSQRLEYNEDLDLGWRLRDLGAVAAFDDSARSAHHHQRGLRGYRRESSPPATTPSSLPSSVASRSVTPREQSIASAMRSITRPALFGCGSCRTAWHACCGAHSRCAATASPVPHERRRVDHDGTEC
jgi:glycosyltransferase involved in cell wall biosynthesis